MEIGCLILLLLMSFVVCIIEALREKKEKKKRQNEYIEYLERENKIQERKLQVYRFQSFLKETEVIKND